MPPSQLLTDRKSGLGALARGEPSIPKPRYPWKGRVLLPLTVVASMLALLAYAARDAILPARSVHVVRVALRSGSTASDSAQSTVQAAGWVEADPYAVSVAALADGTVKEVLVLEGQTVKAGDVVARLVDDDAKLALKRAESELADRQAMLIAAQKRWDNPTERTRALEVSLASVQETQAEMAQLDAEVAVEAARVDELADQLKRAEQAFETRALSEIEVVGTRLKLKAQQATLVATKAKRQVLEGQLKQKLAEVKSAEEGLRLRIEEEQSLASAKAAGMLADAALSEAQLRLSRMEVRAPSEGVVLERLVEPGSKMMQIGDDVHSAHVVRLFDPNRLQVRVDVPIADASKVGVGMSAQVVVGVLPDRVFEGKVTRIVQQADVTKNTQQVKVAITNPAAVLKPEMLARVRFVATASTDGPTTRGNSSLASQVVFAPQELLKPMQDHFSTWVVNSARGTAEQRMVRTGSEKRDGWVAVLSGLNPGDSLIADSDGLSEGQRVRVVGEREGSKDMQRGPIMSFIECRGLTREYHRGDNVIRPLDQLDLDVERGTFLALMGPSGSGKTTLLNLIAGIDHPTSGSLTIDGQRIDQLSRSRLAAWRAGHVGYVFQLYNLVPVLTAYENVELPLLLHELSSKQRHEKVSAALNLVALDDRADHFPRQLSGGQEQRVAIARAIVADPDILVADEPTGDLDKTSAGAVMDLLKRLNRELGKTLIMVTHDPRAAENASIVLHLEKGRLVESPAPVGSVAV